MYLINCEAASTSKLLPHQLAGIFKIDSISLEAKDNASDLLASSPQFNNLDSSLILSTLTKCDFLLLLLLLWLSLFFSFTLNFSFFYLLVFLSIELLIQLRFSFFQPCFASR
jgi:hypothetical protein